MLRLVLVGSVAVLSILIAVACGGGDSPTSTVARDSSGRSEATAVPTSTVARDSSGSSEATAVPTSTVARDSSGSSEATAVPTSTVARDSSGSSEVAEYAVWCDESTAFEGLMTWGQYAEEYPKVIDAFEGMSAPEELKAFHDAMISSLKAGHDFVRMQDPSEPHDSAAMNDELRARLVALLDVVETLDGETKSQLVDAGCP